MPETVNSPPARPLQVALVGNPNTGKSTLFSALAGIHTRVGNYPGVTVEKKVGRVQWDGRAVDLIDLPGTYSLSPRSADEMVSVDVLMGRQPDVGSVDAVVCIADASNLERNLYLLSQVLDLDRPTVLVLNMADVARGRDITIDVELLRQRLGIPIVEAEAHRGSGLDAISSAVFEALDQETVETPRLFPAEFYDECQQLADDVAKENVPSYLVERLLLDVGGHVEEVLLGASGDLSESLSAARARLGESGCRIPAVEAEVRYQWAGELLSGVVSEPQERRVTFSDKLDRVLTHRFSGLVIFIGLMFLVFQAIYSWAGPLMDACGDGQEWLGSVITGSMSPGPLRSLLVDGIVGGVGAVLVFLPQIVLLFLLVAVLEDCGYMARSAFLMDKLMVKFGLSGKSFVPLMSSFACAIPGIMATRVIESRRDRMITILVAPLMSCSARLPVYVVLIGAFIPEGGLLDGWITWRGLVLFAMSLLGAVVAIPVAWLLRTTFFPGETMPFVMELPEYKVPTPRAVFGRVYDRGRAFVMQAGTLIFVMTIVVWAAGSFPGDRAQLDEIQQEIEQLETAAESVATQESLDRLKSEHNLETSRLIEESLLGQLGHLIEPAVRPLGWDWRIGVGAIASFPAREVFIATLGTIYSLGGDVDEEDSGLQGAMRASTWPDGRAVFDVPVALSVMVFFALCAQCASTLVVIRRETNSWRWPIFCFVYMTVLAYIGALVTFQVGSMMG